METIKDIQALIQSNPKAKEKEVVEALRIFASSGGDLNKGYRLAIPYSMPIPLIELLGNDEPRHVKLTTRR